MASLLFKNNSPCGILPPHILDSILKNGSQEQKAAAQYTIEATESFRIMRQQNIPTIENFTRPHKNRLIYTASNTTSIPGKLVRSEGQASTGDVEVNEAYDDLGMTYDLFWKVFQRDSIDNAGQNLIGVTHYGVKYNNAFWDGTQMVFGDGDGTLFNRFTSAIDVPAHELTHGVTGATAKLVYRDQPGALNESMSDVFGSLVKQYSLGQTAAAADWLIGAGLFTSRVKGVALRSMKAPGTAYDDPVLGKDPQPAHMSNYVNTTSDNGGVHINSGIPNKAFYLAAIALGGYAWEKAGQIWFKTLTDSRLGSSAQFQDFANLTADNANALYGATVRDSVISAWQQVGINVAAGPAWVTKTVLSVFTSPHTMNAWAYIADIGWRKVQTLTPDGVINTFHLLKTAHAYGKKVNVYIDGSFIYQAYMV